MKKITQLVVVCIMLIVVKSAAQNNQYLLPGNGNPLVPGYFADPTVKKFGNTYYIYATTDGVMLASGEPQVWVSNDFVNWFNYELNLPKPKNTVNCWAPDVLQGPDGKFYYFNGNCENGCNIFGYVADNPIGPWQIMNNGNPIIPAGTGAANYPSLDAQYLLDGDTALYAYYGTWAVNNGGLGCAKISTTDFTTIESAFLIPPDQLPDVFEAAYPLKRNNKYILMYSAGDCRYSSYRVRYSHSNSPTGPFTPGITNQTGEQNTILETNSDKTVDGPGHHSVLADGDNYFIVYHRHDNPNSAGGEFRQICADSMIFENDSTIRRIEPSHTGIGYLQPTLVPQNIAYQVSATATSYYSQTAKNINYNYLPKFAVDQNNGTMWKASTAKLPQSITLDMGNNVDIKRVTTEFEYTTYYYQYYIEYSDDSTNWQIFADRTANRLAGCPMVDDGQINARYLRLTVTATEKAGFYAAVWGIKVYQNTFDIPVPVNNPVTEGPGVLSTNRLLVDFNMANNTLGYDSIVTNIENRGVLGGTFTKRGKPVVGWADGIRAMFLNGSSYLALNVSSPESLNWNSPYTASAWVYNPVISSGECILAWCARNNMGLQSSYTCFNYGSGNAGAAYHSYGETRFAYSKVPAKKQWHHIALTFDGMTERVYVDGKLDNEYPVMLFVQNGKIFIGSTSDANDNFNGYIANVQLYDSVLNLQSVNNLLELTRPPVVTGPVSGFNYGQTKSLNVYYSKQSQQIVIKNYDNQIIKQVNVYTTDGRLINSFNNLSASDNYIPFTQKGIFIIVTKASNSVIPVKIENL